MEPSTSQLQEGDRPGLAVHHEATVPATIAFGTPLPTVLFTMHPDRFPTMTKARQACRKGRVLVNGKMSRCEATAGSGDKIALQFPVKRDAKLRVVYEDDVLAVIFKPEGLRAHPPPWGKNLTVAMALQFVLRPAPEIENAVSEMRICHRLDQPTSGLMLCAKNKATWHLLKLRFRQRAVHKEYRAIVCGWVEGDEGHIDALVEGKTAQTSWRVLSRARSISLGGSHITELALFPVTGRQHQLRLHCAEVLSTPIVGDKQYGGDDAGSGLYLSAIELSFAHPEREEPLHVQVDVPLKFGALLESEQSQWEAESSQSSSES